MDTSVVLGRDIATGEPVYLSAEARKLSAYLVGKPGGGKSTELESIAIQDMENGEGLCFVDPASDSVERLLQAVPAYREGDVILWDPTDTARPFGLNPFFCADPQDLLMVASKADNFIGALSSLREFSQTFANAPRMKSVLQHVAQAFIVNQGFTLAETPEFLTNAGFRQRFYPALSPNFVSVRQYWERFDTRPERAQMELIESSLNKLERFQSNPVMAGIFAQSTNSLDLRAIMDEGKILLVKLSDHALGPDNAAIVGAFLIWEILQAALSRTDVAQGERRQFHLIADEFQNFMTTAFPRLQAQARKYGVDTIVAHQARGQLDGPSRQTTLVVGNKIVFSVSGQDAAELAKEFKVQPPPPLVTGQRPKYELAPNPLEHIADHPHGDEQVVEANGTCRRLMDDLFHYTLTVVEPESWGRWQTPTPVAPGVVTLGEDMLRRSVNEFVYKTMQTGSSLRSFKDVHFVGDIDWYLVAEIRETLQYDEKFFADRQAGNDLGWEDLYALYDRARGVIADGADRFHRSLLPGIMIDAIRVAREAWQRYFESLRKFKAQLDRLYKDLRSQHGSVMFEVPTVIDGKRTTLLDWAFDEAHGIDKQLRPDSTRPGWAARSSQRWGNALDLVSKENVLAERALELGLRLAQKPCYVASGQLEPIVDKPRLYSDVEAEIANELTTLPRFTARCVLVENGEPAEHTIAISPYEPRSGLESWPVPGDSDPSGWERAEAIREESRFQYGRAREAVVDAIAERLCVERKQVVRRGAVSRRVDITADD